MKHRLIDFGSVIPNLALMKISSWAKAKGDEVLLLSFSKHRKGQGGLPIKEALK